MRHTMTRGVRICGIASAVPDRIVTSADESAVFGQAEMEKIAATTGIRERRVVPEGICTSDLCIAAADLLLERTNVARESIDALVLVTQTPDYTLPATACSLHGRMGLATGCAAFDVNLGCSGYTYGLWMAAHLIAGGGASRVLLLAGDTITRVVNPLDRSARPLFGDAGTATIVEADPSAGEIRFVFGTDGTGQNDLSIPAGGFRLPSAAAACDAIVGDDGNARRLTELHMDGSAVFNFTLDRVVPLIREAIRDAAWSAGDIDAALFHQANEFMLKHIAKATKLPWEKVPCSLGRFGNTSSASIPLTMTTALSRDGVIPAAKLLLAGFGVGLSWCSATLATAQICAPPLLEVDNRELLRRLHDTSPASRSHLSPALRAAHVSR
jgi:3-oxoacyl-[acyl-carrier-protein] synthase-3